MLIEQPWRHKSVFFTASSICPSAFGIFWPNKMLSSALWAQLTGLLRGTGLKPTSTPYGHVHVPHWWARRIHWHQWVSLCSRLWRMRVCTQKRVHFPTSCECHPIMESLLCNSGDFINCLSRWAGVCGIPCGAPGWYLRKTNWKFCIWEPFAEKHQMRGR